MSMYELSKLRDLYEKRREEREEKLREFYAGKLPYIIIQRPSYNIWGACNSIDEIYQNNIEQLQSWLAMDWSDELPHMQPWIGTGVYANAFGCDYLWRDHAAPDTHYKYHKLDEIKNIEYPDYRKSPVMGMVLEAIRVLRDRTEDAFPIALTDTQSPCDTATLVLDTVEFFIGCYTEPEIINNLMGMIADLIIEFSNLQMETIGEELVSQPGHVMPSLTRFRGITLSDDNFAVSSPAFNEKFSIPADEKIGDAFGGAAIHSCGTWDHTMEKLKSQDGFMAIDAAISKFWDPNPNEPAAVRDALEGSGVIVKARCSPDKGNFLTELENLVRPGIRLILDIPLMDENGEACSQCQRNAEENYKVATDKLDELYSAEV